MKDGDENDALRDEAKPAWWRRPGCLLLTASGLLVLAAFFAFCVYVPPLRISEETTRITGPLTPDGQIDFLKHLEETTYPPEMKTDDNGFRVFLRTFGDISEGRNDEFYRRQKYEKLGLDPEEKPTMTMPPEPEKIIAEYFVQKAEEKSQQEIRELFSKPWTVEQLPMMTDWLAEIDAPLDATAEMVRKPVFFPPLLESPGRPQDLIEILLPDAQLMRSVARQFQARANHRIAVGDIEGAIDDTLSIHRLASGIAGGGSLVQYLIGVAINSVGYSIPLDANPAYQPNVEQWRRFFENMNEPFPPLNNSLEWERCAVLNSTQNIWNAKFWNDSNNIMFYYRHADMNIAYRYINEAFDTLTGRRPRSEFHRYTVEPDLKRIAANAITSMGRGRLVGEIVTSQMMPAIEAVEEAERRNMCAFNMQRLTLALLAYKAEHGDFPKEDWLERIKPYLGEEPEKFLRCPSCVSLGFGTNYALILHEKPPEDLDTILLIELREPVPPEEAFFTPEEALQKFSRGRSPRPIGSMHPGIMNTSRRTGSVEAHSVTVQEEELRRLLGLETPAEP